MSSTALLDPPGSQARAVEAASLIDAHKIYGGGDNAVHALDGVDVSFHPGEFTAVMGPSGSGKSTLMHCAAGLDHLTRGQAFIGDVDLSTLTERELTILRRTDVGFIFQAFNLIATLNVAENISLPLTLGGARVDPEAFDRVVTVLGLGDRLTHRPS